MPTVRPEKLDHASGTKVAFTGSRKAATGQVLSGVQTGVDDPVLPRSTAGVQLFAFYTAIQRSSLSQTDRTYWLDMGKTGKCVWGIVTLSPESQRDR